MIITPYAILFISSLYPPIFRDIYSTSIFYSVNIQMALLSQRSVGKPTIVCPILKIKRQLPPNQIFIDFQLCSRFHAHAMESGKSFDQADALCRRRNILYRTITVVEHRFCNDRTTVARSIGESAVVREEYPLSLEVYYCRMSCI